MNKITVYTKLDRIKDFLLRNPGILNEVGSNDDFTVEPIMVFQNYEFDELKETLGAEDFERFVDLDKREFDISGWLKEHCFSEKSFVLWLNGLPEPTEEELGEITVNKNGFARCDYPKKRFDV